MCARRRSISAAVREAFVEGKIIRKTGAVIKRSWSRMIAAIDKAVGRAARKILYGKTEVVPRKIMFITFQGEYTCNPKYITEELIRRGVDCDIVWSLRKAALRRAEFEPSYIPKGVRCVDQFSEAFFEEITTSQVWIANSVDFLKRAIPKKDSQIFFETWHGSLGLKRFDAEVNSGRAWVKAAKLSSKYADFLLSNSLFEDDVYRTSFWPDTPILHYGHPRNDVFFHADEEQTEEEYSMRQRFCAEYEVDETTHFALYAPTFRDDHEFNYYSLNSSILEEALIDRFGGEWKLLVRYHPSVWKDINSRANPYCGIDVSKYPDIQELMLLSDVAITDYSSWIYDFMLSRKPCFIYATDLDRYTTKERGFYYPIATTPFAIATDNDEMSEVVKNFNEDEYLHKLDLFLKDKGCFEAGDASQRVVDAIETIFDKGKEQAMSYLIESDKA